MKGVLGITLLVAACVFSILWTVWYFFGHLTGRVDHLQGAARSAYQCQMKGYKAERRGDLQEAVDAYGESLRVDPTNRELESRRAQLLEVIAGRNENS